MDKDTVLTNESAITIRSNPSSLLDSDDAESSHDSIDTIATTEQKTEKDMIATSIPTRRRAFTVTQSNHDPDNIKTISGEENMDMVDIHGQIHELEPSIQSSHNNDSDPEHDDDVQENLNKHSRDESHRSTMSSIHSFVSSASNYDLLLARLGSKDTPTTSSTSLDTPTQEIRNSFERVKSDAVDNGEEDEIDWGK